jgi:HK97 family phage portal protein
MRVIAGGDNGAPAITPSNALQLATVLACARVLAESISMLPLELRQRLQPRGSLAAVAHPVYTLLHDLPNPEMTSSELRSALGGHLALYGNAYAQLVSNNAGQLMELWPLRPDRTAPLRAPDGSLVYEHTDADGEKKYFRQAEVLHIRGLSFDGLIGYSPIATARRVFDTKSQMETYEESFYRNGARPGVVLKHPQTLSPGAYQKLLNSWQSRHGGANNANRIAILEEGMQLEDLGVSQADAQFLESQKYTTAQIAALFRVPLHMINDLDRATFANIEQMSLEFVIYSLTPWLVAFEQAISRSMLQPSERSRYYAKHKLQALLRGDSASRSAFYASGLQYGWLSINDVRELEDLNPIGAGDTYFVPLNMMPIDQAIQQTAQPGAAGGQRSELVATTAQLLAGVDHGSGCQCDSQQRAASQADGAAAAGSDDSEDLRRGRVDMARAMHPIFEDVAARMVRREVTDISRQAAKNLRSRGSDDFLQWLASYYGDFASSLRDAFRPALLSVARHASAAAAAELQRRPRGLTDQLRSFADEYLAQLADGWCASARTQLEIVLNDAATAGSDPVAAISDRLQRWQDTKISKVADRQSFESLNALLLASYGVYGITRFRWLASGSSCPYCRQLAGKSAGIEEHIISAGSALDGDGHESGSMQIRRNVRHGPLHGGCDCTVAAER